MGDITRFQENVQIEARHVGQVAVQSRETAEIQAQMVIAKRFPRDEKRVFDAVLLDCQRPSLAEKAIYSYSRGGAEIGGASIHLAKGIARRYGNIKSGIVELEQRPGESVCEAYCIDLESNYRESKIFTVPHIRYTKNGARKLEDPRDIYELVANNGSRRERACILAVLPPDLVDEAVRQCEATLRASADCSPANVKSMLGHFQALGVTKEMIEARIQRRIDTITPAQMVSLRNIFNSLKDGMSAVTDWFEAQKKPEEQAKKGNAALAESLEKIPETVDCGDAVQGDMFADQKAAENPTPEK